jgi:hypothetical protein
MAAVFNSNTRTLFFDLEYWVPPESQSSRFGSLLANPGRPGQRILGGSFCLMESVDVGRWPPRVEEIELRNFWIWDYEDEKSMLLAMIEYLRGCWSTLEGKKDREADLILCGIGLSRFDVPVIAFRCNELEVASSEEIWELLFTTKQVDLSNVGIAFPSQKDREASWVLYPKTANELCREFGVESTKPSGKRVWDMFEEGDYAGIQARTEGEVRNLLSLYKRMRKVIFSGP